MPERRAGDLDRRERALDTARSFIVQAPAGSGKTELLIQRVLALLPTVEAPEEIIAITFTRKAAGEMRDRIQAALLAARSDEQPVEAHRQATWRLARAVRRHDADLGWGLDDNPARLRILTIDALCAGLARQMPVLSRFGAPPPTLDDAMSLHRRAARDTLAALDGDDAQAARCVASLLAHVDNDAQLAETLLARMLAQRDQWLRHVADRDSPRLERATLEAGIERLIVEQLVRLAALVPAALAPEWLAVARFAACNLRDGGANDARASLADLTHMPPPVAEALGAWCALADVVLKQDGHPRSRFDVNGGFPPSASTKDKTLAAQLAQWKARARQVALAVGENAELRHALDAIRMLSHPRYSDAQWEVLQALVAVLPLAVAHLQLVFRERRCVDFSAVSQAALLALGDEEAPTDLALALDYRIRHLLVDEFQDTSHAQFDLLVRLTAGWQEGDGRTLFVVGDPMQSIYRFREAEVALYLRARSHGIGHVRLEPLQLTTNFRSQKGVVDWVNAAFSALLPRREDAASGAVAYSPSQSVHDALDGPAVLVHPVIGRDREAEARAAIALVRAALDEGQAASVAVLVRSRSHLAALVPEMKRAGLRPHAVDIDALSERPVIADLHALTRALLHPADRIAWLAILRAPWCGLALADLETLAGSDRAACVADLLACDALVDRLSADGRLRVHRLRDVLFRALAQRGRIDVARWIEGAWLALGGPATVQGEADLDDARVFFELLGDIEVGGDIADFAALAARIGQLFALPDADADPRLQVMTMHKAKGLEFDVVILPGLGHAPRSVEQQLLMWLEREGEQGSDLLLAPMKDRTGRDDRFFAYLSRLDAIKSGNEDARLLYVAATRAKRRLHLIGHVRCKDGEPRPAAGSLLACLWPVVESHYRDACAALGDSGEVEAAPRMQARMTLRRLSAGWFPPPPPDAVAAQLSACAAPEPEQAVEFSWASHTARHVGTVVHAFLQRFAEEGLDGWDAVRLRNAEPVIARDLRALGVPAAQLADAVARVLRALVKVRSDERARWLLAAHGEAECELALSTQLDGAPIDLVIDRTFVDDSGTRWIVDYKTGAHEGADLESFLDREQLRYRDQLERYAAVMGRMDRRPIRLGLYFPLLGAWREWPAATA